MKSVLSNKISIALVVPVRNEEDSFLPLWNTIVTQTYQPDRIVFVDAGSTDGTVDLISRTISADSKSSLVLLENAMPGEARNSGIEETNCDWIALTDGGIKLDPNWLEELVKSINRVPNADIVYGNYEPQTPTFFETCAAIAYAPKKWSGAITDNQLIRAPFIASSIVKKSVWKTVGGFPKWRAAEDLIFMDTIKERGFNIVYAPKATVYWRLRPDIKSTLFKFFTYSKHNVWAGMQKHWHYGIIKHHSLYTVCFLLLLALPGKNYVYKAVLSGLLVIIGYTIRGFRSVLLKPDICCEKRQIYNLWPVRLLVVSFILLIIDFGMYAGWIVAKRSRRDSVV